MSAIFEVEIREGLQTPDGKNVAPPALKLVLLALADHAGDDGEGAYPSMTRLETKTGLSRPTVSNALQALMNAGWIERVGVSRLGTSSYRIIHPSNWPSKPSLLVNPVYQGSKPTLLGVVNPLYLNHHINHPLTNDDNDDTTQEISQNAPPARPNSFRTYEQEIGPLTPMIADALKDFEVTYTADWTIAAIKEASLHGARNMAYITAVLKGWKANGFGNRPQDRKKSPIANQHEMTIDEMLEASVKP